MAAVASFFCAIVPARVLASITSSERGWTFVYARMQLSCVYLLSTLDVTHMIKCNRLSPSLAGTAWERGYHLFIELLNKQADVTISCSINCYCNKGCCHGYIVMFIGLDY